LLTAKSKGKLPVVWLHTISRREWAVLHTMQRHGVKKVAILGVSLSRRTISASVERLQDDECLLVLADVDRFRDSPVNRYWTCAPTCNPAITRRIVFFEV
jgi:hypothetical protein